jgi:alpha-glucoside transport system substrate-binding protein
MRRRDALSALALFTLAGAAGCGTSSDSLRVVALWNGWELTQFHDVLTAFSRRGPWHVSLLSAGNDLGAFVGNRVARTAAPDVALVQRPQMVSANLERLVPLTPSPGVPADWTRLLTFGGHLYGSWFKVAHKSLVWYRTDRLRGEPEGWEAWVALCRDMAVRGEPPLAIGAADGWVLTDWFENALAAIDPGTYARLARGDSLWRHPSVALALARIAEIWSIPGVFTGGPRRALLTQFDGALVQVFEHGSAAMVAGADFFYPIIRQNGSAPASWFRFPCRISEPLPLVAAGDAAVLLRPGKTAARALISWLGSPDAARPWAATGGLLSLNPRVTDYPGDLSRLATEIRQPAARGVTFDLSDQLGGGLVGSDGHGTWRIFQEFFSAVAERPSAVAAAIPRAVDALDRASRKSS